TRPWLAAAGDAANGHGANGRLVHRQSRLVEALAEKPLRGPKAGRRSARPMKILVTGRTGQLARCLAQIAWDAPGVEVVTVGRPQFDLLDAASIARTFLAVQPDLVVSAAAYTAVDKAESEEEEAFAINA